MFYGVKVGKIPGVYTTWDECKENTNGYPNAQFKKFKTEQEALDYINGNVNSVSTNTISNLPSIYAFVDGSFNEKENLYGYGGFLVVNNEKFIIQGSGNEPEMCSMRNVSGEILGAMAAITLAMSKKLSEITIFYDYKGIECWATGEWKTNKEGTKAYKEFVDASSNLINIKFEKVKGHSGIEGNEEADKLAKEAVHIK